MSSLIKTLFMAQYLGQKCLTPDGEAQLVAIGSIMFPGRVSVHFGSKMTHTKNCVDGGYDKKRNFGDYNITSEYLVPIGGDVADGFEIPGGVTLLLRDVSQLTQTERYEVGKLSRLLNGSANYNDLDFATHGEFYLTGDYEAFQPSICDYLRAIGILTPFTALIDGKPKTYTTDELKTLGWVKIREDGK